jgi:hypothetical protein
MTKRRTYYTTLTLSLMTALLGLILTPWSLTPPVVAGKPGAAGALAADAPNKAPDAEAECIRSARERVERLVQAGYSPTDVERTFQTAMALCAGPGVSAQEANFIGALNIELFRLARLVSARKLSPAEYLRLVRDRARKARLAHKDQNWLPAASWCDDDGDLIPNDHDRCPNTRDLTATDDKGCPSAERLPPAPSERDLQRVLEATHLAISPACEQAATPNTPELLQITDRRGFKLNSLLIDFTVRKVLGQPPGCIVYYVFEYDLTNKNCPDRPDTAHGFIIMQTSDIVTTDQTTSTQEALRIVRSSKETLEANDDRSFFAWSGNCYNEWRWRVRAINGNGLTSHWSEWVSKKSVLGEPG